MLVLSRKQNQEVCIPDLGVNIKVLQVKGNTVRLGFEAPEDVRVLIGELNECQRNEFRNSEFQNSEWEPISSNAELRSLPDTFLPQL